MARDLVGHGVGQDRAEQGKDEIDPQSIGGEGELAASGKGDNAQEQRADHQLPDDEAEVAVALAHRNLGERLREAPANPHADQDAHEEGAVLRHAGPDGARRPPWRTISTRVAAPVWSSVST